MLKVASVTNLLRVAGKCGNNFILCEQVEVHVCLLLGFGLF